MYKHVITKSNSHLVLLDALSDPVRLQIALVFHGNKELTVGGISEQFMQSRQTISHHLQIMERAGVVRSEKVGREIRYTFCKTHVIDQFKAIVAVLEKEY